MADIISSRDISRLGIDKSFDVLGALECLETPNALFKWKNFDYKKESKKGDDKNILMCREIKLCIIWILQIIWKAHLVQWSMSLIFASILLTLASKIIHILRWRVVACEILSNESNEAEVEI